MSRYYNQLSTARYDEDLRQIDAELVKQKGRLTTIDAQLKAHGGYQTPQAADDKGGQDSLVAQLEALRTQRALANADLQGDAAQAGAASGDAQTKAASARREILDADPMYRALDAQATSSATLLASAKAQYTSRYPGLPQMQAKAAMLKAAAANEANRALSSPGAYSPTLAAAQAEQRKAQAIVEGDQAMVAAFDG